MGLFEKYAFYIFYLCGLVLSTFLVWRYRQKARIKTFIGSVLSCVFFLAVSYISAYLFAAFEDVITGNVPNGEISTFGGFLFGVPLLILVLRLFRMEMKGCLDLYALFACPTLIAARCVCLVNGCCVGKYILNMTFRWPTIEVEILFYIIILIVLLKSENKKRISGTFSPLVMGSYGCFRFVCEFFREGQEGLLHLAHLWSMICAIVGFSVYCEMYSQNMKRRKEK